MVVIVGKWVIRDFRDFIFFIIYCELLEKLVIFMCFFYWVREGGE